MHDRSNIERGGLAALLLITAMIVVLAFASTSAGATDSAGGVPAGATPSNMTSEEIADIAEQLGVSEADVRLEQELLPEISALSEFVGMRPGFTLSLIHI